MPGSSIGGRAARLTYAWSVSREDRPHRVACIRWRQPRRVEDQRHARGFSGFGIGRLLDTQRQEDQWEPVLECAQQGA
jgi:hypothetical protein